MPMSPRCRFPVFLLAIFLLIAGVAAVRAQEQGADCYRTLFQAQAVGHEPVNAYLLMLANYYSYENRINAAGSADFQKRFREKFAPWGFDEFDFLDVRMKTADTQVMIMSNDQATIVVFRGSETGSTGGNGLRPAKAIYDWILTDFNFFPRKVKEWGSGVKVHRGFFNAWAVVSRSLCELCTRHLAKPGRKLWITGHSLGAGVAPMAAMGLAAAGLPVQGVYTYAGPRIGNQAFVDATLGRLPFLQRWVNDHDLVTMVPFTWMGFRHLGKPNNLYENGTVALQDQPFTGLGKVAPHSPGLYLQRLFDSLPLEVRDQLPAPPSFRGADPGDAELEQAFARKLAARRNRQEALEED